MDDMLAAKAFIEPERISLPIRLALNWVNRGLMPPDLYAMTYRWAYLTLYARDLLAGDESERQKKKDEEE